MNGRRSAAEARMELFLWVIIGAAIAGAIRVIAARKAARRTGVAFWDAYASRWFREPMAGLPAGVVWTGVALVVVVVFLLLAVR